MSFSGGWRNRPSNGQRIPNVGIAVPAQGNDPDERDFLNHLYGGMVEPELKIIDVFVCKLRKKLVEATGEDSCIQTVWGRGYVLKDPLPDIATQKIAV